MAWTGLEGPGELDAAEPLLVERQLGVWGAGVETAQASLAWATPRAAGHLEGTREPWSTLGGEV